MEIFTDNTKSPHSVYAEQQGISAQIISAVSEVIFIRDKALQS